LADLTIKESRHNLAREANHEAVAIVGLLKTKLTGLDVSLEDLMLMRGLAQRLDLLTDVIYDTVINDDEIDEGDISRRLGLEA